MRVAVLFAKDEPSAPSWLPSVWPYSVKQLAQGCREVPDSRWILMMPQDLIAHKARLQEVYDIAFAANAEPLGWKDPDEVQE